jgi:CheY-like chemotaxis protein
VLLVDDEADTRDMLSMILEHAGYQVTTAGNGEEALVLLRAIRPDLILLDIQMPIMSGAEFRQAQRHDRDLMKIPTIVMTGSTEETQLDLAVSNVLQKPFLAKDLLTMVAALVNRSSPRT